MTGSEDRAADDVLHRHLIQRVAQSLDRDAFAQLFDRIAPRLKSFMLRKGVTTEQAEDLVQEAMLTLWRKAGLYDPAKGSVITWAFTIARNLRIDRLRRESSMPLTTLDDYDEVSDEPGGEEMLSRKQAQAHVARALQEIPPEQREVLILSFVEDVPQSEIAARLSLPLGTVKSRMRLAYSRLRKSLESLA
jgi:RNA polymerase sigma-70 factor, ECF subfamily